MQIKLRCDPNLIGHLPEPQPASAFLPDWLSRMPARAHSEGHGHAIRTVKQCPPFVDAMRHGFIIPLPCDVEVRDGQFRWDWDLPMPAASMHHRAPLSFHVPEQLAGTPLHSADQVAVKFNSFWTVELPEGYSLYAIHPANRLDLPFRLISGMVDSDRYHEVGVLFPGVWVDPDFEGTLPAGMPVAQCFPVKREALDLVVEAMPPERVTAYDDVTRTILGEPGVYRKRYRGSRPRSVGPEEASGGGGAEEQPPGGGRGE